MNLKNNKGYTGIDVSVAMIIILIFIPTIFGIIYNLQRIRVRTEREANAIDIATDVLEIAKNLEYTDVVISNQNEFKTKLDTRYSNATYDSSIDTQETNYNYMYYAHTGTNKEHYRIQIGILNYHPDGETNIESKDFVKRIKVKVTYPIGKTTKSIDISTVLQNK